MARSTFYYNLKKSKQPEPYLIEKERIKQIYDQHKGRYGYRRITLQLRNEGYLLNQKTVYKLMGELKLKAKIRIKKYRSYKGEIGRIAPNIINREFYCDRPYEKLVTDVTEVKINGVKAQRTSCLYGAFDFEPLPGSQLPVFLEYEQERQEYLQQRNRCLRCFEPRVRQKRRVL